MADIDNTLEMFGYNEENKNMVAGRENVGSRDGFYVILFFIEDADGNDPDKEND